MRKITLSVAFAFFSSLLFTQIGHGEEIGMLVLKDESQQQKPPVNSQAHADAFRTLARKRAEMRTNGYIEVTSTQLANEHEPLLRKSQAKRNYRNEFELGFEPLSFSEKRREPYEYLGAVNPQQTSEPTHELLHFLEHKSLGDVTVMEYSYATDESTKRFAISSPPDNVKIRGLRSGYLVMRDEESELAGVTHVWFVTDSKYVKAVAYMPIQANTAEFAELMRLVRSLAR